MKISEIITDKYKLRLPPTVYYELLADVQEAEEEQEHILDKIRAEIMALRNIRAEVFDIDSDVFDDRVILRSDVLEIINKYKAESEVNNGTDSN